MFRGIVTVLRDLHRYARGNTMTTTTTTRTFVAQDNTRRSMTEKEATRIAMDASDAALITGREIAPAVFHVVAGVFSIKFDWSRNKVTITDLGDTLLFVATITRQGVGVVSWVQSGWCWRQALNVALK